MRYQPGECDEADELATEERLARARHNRYMAHPDPRDPLWPGHDYDNEEDEGTSDD